jgi:hypothetical protein
VKLLSDSPASGRYRHLSANLAASVPYVLCAHFLSGIKTFCGLYCLFKSAQGSR